MSDRSRRHAAILRILTGAPVPGQAALAAALEAEGFRVTQATLSRDLARIGVVRGPSGYTLPPTAQRAASGRSIDAAIRREAISVDLGVGLVVMRTRPGHANALAVELDTRLPEGVIGCIAGDDTIFLAMRSADAAERLVRHIASLLSPPPSRTAGFVGPDASMAFRAATPGAALSRFTSTARAGAAP